MMSRSTPIKWFQEDKDGVSCHIGSKKWYSYFKSSQTRSGKTSPGLCDELSRDQLYNSLLVHFTLGGRRLFTAFPDHQAFLQYEGRIDRQKRGFFETILGEKPQKPHFDLDIDLTDQKSQRIIQTLGGDVEQPETLQPILNGLMENVIQAIGLVLQPHEVTLDLTRDVLLFSSHGTQKKSFHLILDNHYHADHQEAANFCQLVLTLLPEIYHHWLDTKVYSRLQQFRLEGSLKTGSDRVKIMNLTWPYHGQTIHYQPFRAPKTDGELRELIFEASLVSQVRGTALPPFQPPMSSRSLGQRSLEPGFSQWLTEEEGRAALELMAEAAGVSRRDPRFPYSFIRVEGGLVILKRIQASKCRLCLRVHEHENPFLVVVGEEKNIFFNCRRNEEGHNLFIGSLLTGVHDPASEAKELTDEELLQLPVIIPQLNAEGDLIKAEESEESSGSKIQSGESKPNRFQKQSIPARGRYGPVPNLGSNVDMMEVTPESILKPKPKKKGKAQAQTQDQAQAQAQTVRRTPKSTPAYSGIAERLNRLAQGRKSR